jgi:hypothetical protein
MAVAQAGGEPLVERVGAKVALIGRRRAIKLPQRRPAEERKPLFDASLRSPSSQPKLQYAQEGNKVCFRPVFYPNFNFVNVASR